MGRIDPELVLKTIAPRSSKTALLRARLSIDRPELAGKVAIAVHGPAGFGKTSLLVQWRREFLAQGAVVGWLTLDGHDDAIRFARGLAAAMAVGSGRQSFIRALERMPGRGREELAGLTDWLAEVADLGSETVLILDEVDALPYATVRDGLAYLLHNAPANLRIVMASRAVLSLPASDLPARGLYVTIAGDALRFCVEETMAVLDSRFAARIDPDLSVRLHDITEGWPLGVQLAIAAVENRPSLVAAIEELSAGAGGIEQYFVDNLLNSLCADQVDFLICIALLDQLHPALCVAITGNEQAGELLRELCAATPIFVEGVDSDWVRIHPLAKEFLRGRSSGLSREHRLDVYERAADWLQEHQYFEEAARQYLLAGRTEQAYAMIEQCLYEILLRGQLNRVLDWIEEFPAGQVESHPHVCLSAAWALAMSARHEEAARFIVLMQQDPNADEATRCEVAAIATAAAYFADQPDEALAIISPWKQALSSCSIKLQAVIADQLAFLALLQGQPEKARRIYLHAPRYAWSDGLDAISGYGEWVVGMTYLYEGRMQPAEAAFRDSLIRAEQDIGRSSPVAVMLASGLAAVLLERGKIQEAAAVLANRLDVLERLASPDAIVVGYLSAARLAVLLGQVHRAHDLLDALFTLGEERDIPRFCVVALTEQIRMHALHGRADTCQTLWRRLETTLSEATYEQGGLLGSLLRLVVGLANSFVCLARRDWPAMLDVLDATNAIAETLRRGREIVQLKLLKALALREMGADGLPFLLEAVSLAEEYGLRRIVQETHPDLVRWVSSFNRETVKPFGLNAHPPVPSPGPVTTNVSPSRLLTPKEQEVLQLLARNLSNKQIAQALDIGEETVKWHMKNLFGKFQADTRKHVVDRAYMLGILESVG